MKLEVFPQSDGTKNKAKNKKQKSNDSFSRKYELKPELQSKVLFLNNSAVMSLRLDEKAWEPVFLCL